jgi:hypothetical protein
VRKNHSRLLPSLFCLLLAFAGCSDLDPVTERLALVIGDDDAVEISSTVVIASVSGEPGQAPLRARAQQMRQDLLTGADAWSRRFALLEPTEERYEWRKNGGEVVSVTRSAEIRRADLARFFSDTSLSFSFFQGPAWEELIISAPAPQRPDPAARELMEGALDKAASSYALYAASIDTLYRYLDQHADRAPLLFDAIGDGPREELSEEEGAMIAAVDRATDAVRELLTVDPGQTLSLQAASRLGYDPFPSDLVITLPGDLIEVDGFEKRDAQTVAVLRRGLWDLFSRFEGKWISPDPLARTIAAQEGEEPEVDFPSLAREPRKSVAPAPADVRAAIEQQLRPATIYRVRWRR